MKVKDLKDELDACEDDWEVSIDNSGAVTTLVMENPKDYSESYIVMLECD